MSEITTVNDRSPPNDNNIRKLFFYISNGYLVNVVLAHHSFNLSIYKYFWFSSMTITNRYFNFSVIENELGYSRISKSNLYKRHYIIHEFIVEYITFTP